MRISEKVSEFLYAIGTLVILTGIFLLILSGW
jgi:hypothetical protein